MRELNSVDQRGLEALRLFLREQQVAYESLSKRFPSETIDLYVGDLGSLFENLTVLMYHRLQPEELDGLLRFFKASRSLALWRADLLPDEMAKVSEMMRILTEDQGQLASLKRQRPIDQLGSPMPWITYPAKEFLCQFDYTDAHVFEFGAGYSTLFWSGRAQQVTAVETDSAWADEVSSMVPENVRVTHQQDETEFVGVLADGGYYDVISIDSAVYRRAAAEKAVRHLRDGGFIIFDNADWYPKTCEMMTSAGLHRIDFHGFGPLNGYAWTTSLFFNGFPRFCRLPRASFPVGGRIVHLADDGGA